LGRWRPDKFLAGSAFNSGVVPDFRAAAAAFEGLVVNGAVFVNGEVLFQRNFAFTDVLPTLALVRAGVSAVVVSDKEAGVATVWAGVMLGFLGAFHGLSLLDMQPDGSLQLVRDKSQVTRNGAVCVGKHPVAMDSSISRQPVRPEHP
jgi:hypothetical protein